MAEHKRCRPRYSLRSHFLPSPLDDDDILSEILRRLPPRPSALPLASRVCRRWRRLVTSPHFLRGFREFHRPPRTPLLGFFHNSYLGNDYRFVGTAARADRVHDDALFRMPCGQDHRDWTFLDCRHGRALLLGLAGPYRRVLVWDPMTGTRHRAPLPPDAGDAVYGALICCCSHSRDCRSSPFQAVLVWWNKRRTPRRRTVATIYSSETRAWSQQVFSALFASTGPAARDARARRGGTVVDDAIYWLLPDSRILQFDTTRLSLALISGPVGLAGYPYWQCLLLKTEDGELGLAMAMESSILVWKRDTSPVAEVWSQHRSIQLDAWLPPQGVTPSLLGFHEESNLIFVQVDAGMFMVQLDSMQSRMVCQGCRSSRFIRSPQLVMLQNA